MAGGQTHTTQHSGQSITFDATVDGGTFSVGGNVGNGPAEFHHSGSASGPGTQVGVSLDGSPLGGLGGDKLMLMNLKDKDLQNLKFSLKKLVKKGKKAAKIGKEAIKVAKDAKHTYDDIKGLRLVNLMTDEEKRDAANRDHDFDLVNLGGDYYKDMRKLQQEMYEKQHEHMMEQQEEMMENGMMNPMMNPMMYNQMAGNNMMPYLANLDTELDYYHSDGKTSFTGNRNTRTHIKDVSMGRGSTTSFGLVNLEDLVKEPEANLVFMNLDDEIARCKAMYKEAHTNPLFTKKTKKGVAFRTQLQEKLSDCKKMEDLLM